MRDIWDYLLTKTVVFLSRFKIMQEHNIPFLPRFHRIEKETKLSYAYIYAIEFRGNLYVQDIKLVDTDEQKS